jgi:hypothetical protein
MMQAFYFACFWPLKSGNIGLFKPWHTCVRAVSLVFALKAQRCICRLKRSKMYNYIGHKSAN